MNNFLETIDAVIYDMDGLLVNSEPLWHIAEKEVFAKVGIYLTTDDCFKTTGLPTGQVFDYWYSLQPWVGESKKNLELELFERVTVLIKEYAEPMLGVKESITYFKNKNKKIGLASASPLFLIDIVLEKLGIKSEFDFFHSALLEKNNKPHPDVYLAVAKKLNTPIERCLILEDSLNGVKGAVASGAKVIAVPESHFFENSGYNIAFAKIKNLLELLDFAH